MDLLDVRKTFVKQAGRYDLVGAEELDGVLVPDYTVDNGANYYINKAHKYLDDKIRVSNQRIHRTFTVAAEQYWLPVTNALAVHDVLVEGISLTRIELPIWLWLHYGGDQPQPVPWDEIDIPSRPPNPATPKWWARNLDNITVTVGEETITPQILFHAEADQQYTMDVIYYAQRATLSDDGDESYWTLNEPELLIDCALMFLAGNILDDKSRLLRQEVEDKIRLIICRTIREEVDGLGGKIIR